MNKVIVFEDKSNKKYCVSKDDYNQEIRNNITSKYKRVDITRVKESDIKAAQIARRLDLDDRMEGHTPSNCFFNNQRPQGEFSK